MTCLRPRDVRELLRHALRGHAGHALVYLVEDQRLGPGALR